MGYAYVACTSNMFVFQINYYSSRMKHMYLCIYVRDLAAMTVPCSRPQRDAHL